PVGCDMMLGSSMREDKCRVCGGDGSTCTTSTGLLDSKDFREGYNDILLIPRGATNIKIIEEAPSNNYLAVRNTTNHYYLNGNWRVHSPRSINFAGCKFIYSRHSKDLSAIDELYCLGPIEESLFIVLLSQEPNVGVKYEYSFPNNVAPGIESETYAWTFGEYSPCSASCGGGVQTRNVSCAGRKSLQPVEINLCQSMSEPPSSQRCNEIPCEAQWVAYPWGRCSLPCGKGGMQTRQIVCQRIVAKGLPSQVPDDDCKNLPKPSTQQSCNTDTKCARWYIEPWKPCDHLCGDGKQTRKVICYVQKEDGKRKVLADTECEQTEAKPPTEQKCNLRPCEGVDWITSEFSGCNTICGLKSETRKVQCASSDNKIYSESFCDAENKPNTTRPCNLTSSSCDFLWYASQWSECSTNCGEGVQTRTIFCGTVTANGVEKVDDSNCNQTINLKFERSCTGKLTECEAEWFSGPWSECSKSCGGGEKTQKVVCIKNNEVVDTQECKLEKILFSTIECNTHACSEDTIIPSDVTQDVDESEPEATTISSTEEYEIVEANTCEGGVWVTEEEVDVTKLSVVESKNAEHTSSVFSTDDLMLSDGTMSTDTDFLTSEIGSGDTKITNSIQEFFPTPSIKNTDDISTIKEGSGDESTITDINLSTKIYSTTDFAITENESKTNSESTNKMTDTDFTTSEANDLSSTENVTYTSTIESYSTTVDTTKTTIDGTETAKKNTEITIASTETTIDSTETTIDGTETTEDATETSNDSTETTIDSTQSTGTEITAFTDSISTESDNTETTTELSTEFTLKSTELSSSKVTEAFEEPFYKKTTAKGRSISTNTDYFSQATDISGTTDIDSKYSSTSWFESTEASTTEITGSTEVSGTTIEFTETTDVSGTTKEFTETNDVSGTTKEITDSNSFSEITESTEFIQSSTGVSELTTETSSSEYDIWSSTTKLTQPTETSWDTTSITELFTTARPRMCKRRKLGKSCKTTQFGCCLDNITPASGPFEKGCPTPKICKESKYGCCEDGVSAALGTKNMGCPKSQCKETLFGCCPDGKTPSNGNNNEDCPPKCASSNYGCCKDNITNAKGPKQKGCEPPKTPCNKSKYGCCPDNKNTAKGENFKGCDIFKDNCKESYFKCCPDGKISAQGPKYEGCELSCSNTTYGCCDDLVTPAHGNNKEGCCLSGSFGCCPDNITPAKGLNLEGCGCQYLPYGCCPDNKTPARGHANEGCGCQFTEFGCCPDMYTPSNGPDYEGCLCHTFQFGCCPDGNTTAKGPHQQGCGCQNSEYKCCSDDKSPAQGPNMEGCGCESTKYGCCLDGVNTATGDNFEGCENVPVNLQDSCALPKERGSCRNYTVKWYFDMGYGGCSRFWYGGCDGNNNRFKSKEECDGVCVVPQGTERCNLPKMAGPCEGYYPNWYYDKERKYCTQFIYGGCLGNNNRFETAEECNKLCVKDNTVDACEQTKEEGPCRGQFKRYYYDQDSKQCKEFNYGGCKGNSNNFQTLKACNQQCTKSDRKKDHCSLPRAQGNCTQKEPKWYYDTPEKRCIPFYYSGCNGNPNNFDNKDACERDCPLEIVKDTCHLPAETGECSNYTGRWYFDTKEKQCRQFYYGGCGGNKNNFENQRDCEERCAVEREPPTEVQTPNYPESEIFRTESCFLPQEIGPCKVATRRYFYDRSDGVCKGFTYGGCEGNQNNFKTAEECNEQCGSAQDLCRLPPVVGPCNGEYEQYYYEEASDSCKTFLFGGCDGNYNRFADKSSCEQRCRKKRPDEYTTREPAPAQVPAEEYAMCYEQIDTGNCTEEYNAFAFDINSQKCVVFTYTGCGGNNNRFNSEEQCLRQCGHFRGQDVCNLPKDQGPCRGYFIKYYYDKPSGSCQEFAFGGCMGNGNRFSSPEECQTICVSHQESRPNITATDEQTSNNVDDQCIDYYNECSTMRCRYGIQAYVDENTCNRCKCHDPCEGYSCANETRCAIDLNRSEDNDGNQFVAICREENKKGTCPYYPSDDLNCDRECNDDADCSLTLKCCSTGCGSVCMEPEFAPGQLMTPWPTYTDKPNEEIVKSPTVNVTVFKPEVQGLIGDHVVLNCAVTGNPNPRITWSKDNVMIDGKQPRYRIKLDQTLQIITLHETDSGVYLCTADNAHGEKITNEIRLDVANSEPRPASVLEQDEQPNVVISLNAPTTLDCFALGFPYPDVTWWKDNSMIPLQNRDFEVRKDYSLHINNVKLHNLGVYTCQAYNGVGKAASWAVTVKARGPFYSNDPKDAQYLQYIVNPPDEPSYTYKPIIDTTSYPNYVLTPDPYLTATYPELDPNEISPTNTYYPDIQIVPVSVNTPLESVTSVTGADITIPCEVRGNPQPKVEWYKNGNALYTSNKNKILGNNTLMIYNADLSDSGEYTCEAVNSISQDSKKIYVSIESIRPDCQDNSYFANCRLIVEGKYCNHAFYSKYCCRSCTLAGYKV
ncbi:unnamed protein product, partial [Brassicogethes aeneus]